MLKKYLHLIELINPKIINSLIIYWSREFNKIIPSHEVINIHKAKKPNDVMEFLILKGLETCGGLESFLPAINTIHFVTHQNNYRKRTKDTLLEISKRSNYSKHSSLFAELVGKINFIAIHYLNEKIVPR